MIYRGRIVSVLIGLLLVLTWDFIYYFVLHYPVDLKVDLVFTVLILFISYYMGKNYDTSYKTLAALRKSEERVKLLNEEMQHVLQSIDEVVFHTNSKGEFQFLNQSWEDYTGYTVKESLHKNALHFISLHERHEILRMVRQSISLKKEKMKMDFSYQKRDGQFRWGEVNVKLNYDENGELLGTVGTISDITERVHNEEELIEMNETLAIESQKLSVAGQLAAGIAHEVRNPLTSINGFLQLLRDDADEKTKEYLGIVFSEIKRIELVLSELLILAKPQSVTYRRINIIETLDHVAKLLNTNAILYNIEIQTDFHERELHIRGDENQLKQVFINLLKNAIESMPHGGAITISADLSSYNKVQLIFKDEGVGMKKETLDKLGEPFFTTKTKGTGLGLTICLRILRDHGADIRVQSEQGEGTTFHIMFEAVQATERKRRETLQNQ
ncbi:ATP-binding protein [Rossellomorea aquimaris]|uniref:histidine kinase n=1 Tax=Rossellomorea aquimaris TaxID=189382 RepID=A0A366EY61_9BACI|nr:ATP-binding protein [Rossellomorea aquimaris]RBP06670.1 PAS/PAC sensor signal transduction histidine kinase [Rossellomorea aquimaris]